MQHSIPVIDLFAGPGGLGEGFSCFRDDSGRNPFTIALSIEKDPNAYQTLEMRSFFRFLDRESDTSDYFRYIRKEITRDELFQKHTKQADKAQATCWLAELGNPSLPYSGLKSRINSAIGQNALWVLIGGPPCQAYSVIGRVRVKSVEPERYENDNRHFLYKEYLKIVAEHTPPVFLMENVKGLLSTEINGLNMFGKILRDLKVPREAIANGSPEASPVRYEIFSLSSSKSLSSLKAEDYIVKSEHFGIPQKRHRVFLLGVRSDLVQFCPKDMRLEPQLDFVSTEEVIGDLPRLRSGLSTSGADSFDIWFEALEGIFQTEWFSSEQVSTKVRREIRKTLSHLNAECLSRGEEYIACETGPAGLQSWYVDPRLHGICNHSTRSHIPEDLHRYLFASCFARVNGYSPELDEYPSALLPKHRNVNTTNGEIIFSDRFRVQLQGHPASTVTSHISKDGHYYIHHDPSQCRSLTVREVARLQTFPDNYYFEGSRTDQYRQVGNAVPPLLAKQIAEKIYEVLHRINRVQLRL